MNDFPDPFFDAHIKDFRRYGRSLDKILGRGQHISETDIDFFSGQPIKPVQPSGTPNVAIWSHMPVSTRGPRHGFPAMHDAHVQAYFGRVINPRQAAPPWPHKGHFSSIGDIVFKLKSMRASTVDTPLDNRWRRTQGLPDKFSTVGHAEYTIPHPDFDATLRAYTNRDEAEAARKLYRQSKRRLLLQKLEVLGLPAHPPQGSIVGREAWWKMRIQALRTTEKNLYLRGYGLYRQEGGVYSRPPRLHGPIYESPNRKLNPAIKQAALLHDLLQQERQLKSLYEAGDLENLRWNAIHRAMNPIEPYVEQVWPEFGSWQGVKSLIRHFDNPEGGNAPFFGAITKRAGVSAADWAGLRLPKQEALIPVLAGDLMHGPGLTPEAMQPAFAAAKTSIEDTWSLTSKYFYDTVELGYTEAQRFSPASEDLFLKSIKLGKYAPEARHAHLRELTRRMNLIERRRDRLGFVAQSPMQTVVGVKGRKRITGVFEEEILEEGYEARLIERIRRMALRRNLVRYHYPHIGVHVYPGPGVDVGAEFKWMSAQYEKDPRYYIKPGRLISGAEPGTLVPEGGFYASIPAKSFKGLPARVKEGLARGIYKLPSGELREYPLRGARMMKDPLEFSEDAARTLDAMLNRGSFELEAGRSPWQPGSLQDLFTVGEVKYAQNINSQKIFKIKHARSNELVTGIIRRLDKAQLAVQRYGELLATNPQKAAQYLQKLMAKEPGIYFVIDAGTAYTAMQAGSGEAREVGANIFFGSAKGEALFRKRAWEQYAQAKKKIGRVFGLKGKEGWGQLSWMFDPTFLKEAAPYLAPNLIPDLQAVPPRQVIADAFNKSRLPIERKKAKDALWKIWRVSNLAKAQAARADALRHMEGVYEGRPGYEALQRKVVEARERVNKYTPKVGQEWMLNDFDRRSSIPKLQEYFATHGGDDVPITVAELRKLTKKRLAAFKKFRDPVTGSVISMEASRKLSALLVRERDAAKLFRGYPNISDPTEKLRLTELLGNRVGERGTSGSIRANLFTAHKQILEQREKDPGQYASAMEDWGGSFETERKAKGARNMTGAKGGQMEDTLESGTGIAGKEMGDYRDAQEALDAAIDLSSTPGGTGRTLDELLDKVAERSPQRINKEIELLMRDKRVGIVGRKGPFKTIKGLPREEAENVVAERLRQEDAFLKELDPGIVKQAEAEAGDISKLEAVKERIKGGKLPGWKMLPTGDVAIHSTAMQGYKKDLFELMHAKVPIRVMFPNQKYIYDVNEATKFTSENQMATARFEAQRGISRKKLEAAIERKRLKLPISGQDLSMISGGTDELVLARERSRTIPGEVAMVPRLWQASPGDTPEEKLAEFNARIEALRRKDPRYIAGHLREMRGGNPPPMPALPSPPSTPGPTSAGPSWDLPPEEGAPLVPPPEFAEPSGAASQASSESLTEINTSIKEAAGRATGPSPASSMAPPQGAPEAITAPTSPPPPPIPPRPPTGVGRGPSPSGGARSFNWKKAGAIGLGGLAAIGVGMAIYNATAGRGAAVPPTLPIEEQSRNRRPSPPSRVQRTVRLPKPSYKRANDRLVVKDSMGNVDATALTNILKSSGVGDVRVSVVDASRRGRVDNKSSVYKSYE